MTSESLTLAAILLLVAAAYAAVGQAGATGYLAVMGLAGLQPAVMKPTALALNILVAAIGTVQFWRAGMLSWRTFYPFAGAILLIAGAQILRSASRAEGNQVRPPEMPPFLPALATGAAIGFVSGTTGTGGGIFLAPAILAMNWVDVRRTAAVTAAYNLLNSTAALAGAYATLGQLPSALPFWLVAVGIGGLIGASVGARYLPERAMRYVLACVLLGSGLKLILT